MHAWRNLSTRATAALTLADYGVVRLLSTGSGWAGIFFHAGSQHPRAEAEHGGPALRRSQERRAHRGNRPHHYETRRPTAHEVVSPVTQRAQSLEEEQQLHRDEQDYRDQPVA